VEVTNKSKIVRLFLCLSLLCIGTFGFQQAARSKEAGLHNIKGWNFASCYFPSGSLGTCSGQDIDGKVGYPLFVNSPRANCKPGGDWSMSNATISGTLPPGLTMLSAPSHIKGIPEKRGHWIVHIKVDHLYCNGESFYGIEQELRFHITGSGRVHE